MRRSISIILAVVMLLSVICIAPASANAITSGNFGYRLTKSGNAVIFNYYGNKKRSGSSPARYKVYKPKRRCGLVRARQRNRSAEKSYSL